MLNNLKDLIPYFPFNITGEALLWKLVILVLLSALCASSIYIINKYHHGIRGKDILMLETSARWYMWVGGAVLTTLILYALQIISYKMISIFLTIFVLYFLDYYAILV